MPIVLKSGSLNLLYQEVQGLSMPVMGLLYLYLYRQTDRQAHAGTCQLQGLFTEELL
jgi:hypothetical protein